MSPEEKADLLGERLLGAVPEVARFLLEGVGGETVVRLSDKNLQQLLIELFVFYMHLLDRMALAELGVDGREIFCDRLIVNVANSLVLRLHKSISSVDFVATFKDTYNQRQVQYAGYRALFPADSEPANGTLVWEVSKILLALTGSSNPVRLSEIVLAVTYSHKLMMVDSLEAEVTLRS